MIVIFGYFVIWILNVCICVIKKWEVYYVNLWFIVIIKKDIIYVKNCEMKKKRYVM